MKAVVDTTASTTAAELFEKARDEDIVVRAPDGAEFVLSPIDDFDREVALTRQNARIMAFLDERAKQTKAIPWEEAKASLGLK